MNARTDCHRPSAIVPAEYSYVLSYHLATTVDSWPVPAFNVDAVRALESAGRQFAQTGGLGKCSICGARFIYGDVWCHESSQELIHVGHDCADKYSLLADRSEFELEAGRRKAASAKECARARNAEERQAFLQAHPGLEEALETDHHIVADIKGRFMSYRTLSPKQVELVFKLAREAQLKAEGKAEEKLVPAPVSSSRITFEGVVVSTKVVESAWGGAIKMVVKVETPAGAWLAWGTAPSACLGNEPLRGRRIRVTAGLKPGREPHFAVLVRPQGQMLDAPASP